MLHGVAWTEFVRRGRASSAMIRPPISYYMCRELYARRTYYIEFGQSSNTFNAAYRSSCLINLVTPTIMATPKSQKLNSLVQEPDSAREEYRSENKDLARKIARAQLPEDDKPHYDSTRRSTPISISLSLNYTR